MEEDVRKTGVSGLKGLKGLNQKPSVDDLPSLDQLKAMSRAYGTGSAGPSLVDTNTHEYEE